MKTTVPLLILLNLFALNTFAQDYTQWGLPEGATARLGKGVISGNIACSPDGTRLAVGSHIGIWLYDTTTYQEVALLTGHMGGVWSVAFSPDGKTIATGEGRALQLWEVDTGTNTLTLTGHTDRVLSVAFSPDGNTIASGGGSEDNTVRLWDANTGANTHTLTGHTRSVNSVAFSPDGNTIASGGGVRDHTVRLWEVDTGANTHTLTGHTGGVLSVAFSLDGNTLASGSSDGTVLLWELTPSTPKSENGESVPTPPVTGDVNGDGGVNIQDLVLVAGQFGQSGENRADVNGDGVVNIQDLVLVASAFGNAAAAPVVHSLAPGSYGTGTRTPTAADVEGWLTQARQMGLTTPDYLRGIAVLEQLLAALTPPETLLLPNYPNPFNPETWIPYHLAHAADVTFTIYDAEGAVARRLDLGHQPAGYYADQSKAAYWDGRNERGETVASGVYFYHLSAGDYSATRKMIIIK